MIVESKYGLFLSRDDKLNESQVRIDNAYKIIFNNSPNNFYQVENKDISYGVNTLLTLQPYTMHKQLKINNRKNLLSINTEFFNTLEYELNQPINLFNLPLSTDKMMLRNLIIFENIMNNLNSDRIQKEYLDATITQLIISQLEYKNLDINEKNQLETYIKNNYQKQVTLDGMARDLNYSKYNLIRIFKNEFDKTPIEYLNYFRIYKATDIMKKKKNTISEIAFLTGYNSNNQFLKWFKYFTFLTPKEYVKKYCA